MIEFVYFDLGNVLWTFEESLACNNVADLLGRPSQAVRAAIYDTDLQTKFEHGKISAGGFVKTLKAELGVDTSIADPMILDASSNMFEPIESMVPVLRSVRDSGTKLGLLSNTCHSHWDWLQRQSHDLMTGRFDAIVLSFEVNSMKPDDQIYRAAELACGVDAPKILFLDDRAENVQAALRRGWQAVQCTGKATVDGKEGELAIDALRRYQVI